MTAKEFLNYHDIDINQTVGVYAKAIHLYEILEVYAGIKIKEESARVDPSEKILQPHHMETKQPNLKPVFHAVLSSFTNTEAQKETYETRLRAILGRDYFVVVHIDKSTDNKFIILSPGCDKPEIIYFDKREVEEELNKKYGPKPNMFSRLLDVLKGRGAREGYKESHKIFQ